jgi:predicted PurR-regulated permease PerM
MSMTNGKPSLALPDLSARTLITATVVVGLVALGFWLLFRFYQVILILLAGIIISVALNPAVNRLRARGIPPGVAVAAIFGLLLLVFLLFLRFVAPLIADQAATIGTQLGEAYAAVVQRLREAPNMLVRQLAEALPAQPGLATPAPEPQSPPADGVAPSPFAQAWGYLGAAAQTVYQIGAIFLIAFFWTIEAERIKRSAVSLLPLDRRDAAREMIAEIETRIGGYVTGQLLLSLIIGSLSFVAYLIIGLPYALALALFVGIMEVIPVIGPLIGAIPAVVIGFSMSPLTALWTVVASLVIHQLEANVFGPRVMKRTMNMRPLVTLLALTAFGTLFGVLGALIALPLASVIQLFLDRLVLEAPARYDGGEDRDRIGVLRYETQALIDDVRKLIRQKEGDAPAGQDETETPEDTLEAIALDLDSLLASYRQTETA